MQVLGASMGALAGFNSFSPMTWQRISIPMADIIILDSVPRTEYPVRQVNTRPSQARLTSYSYSRPFRLLPSTKPKPALEYKTFSPRQIRDQVSSKGSRPHAHGVCIRHTHPTKACPRCSSSPMSWGSNTAHTWKASCYGSVTKPKS